MNVYLLQLLGKWLSLVMIAALSLFHNIGFQAHKVKIDNPTKNMNLNVENQVIAHETQTIYTKRLPNGVTKVVTEGQDGLIIPQADGTTSVIQEMIPAVVQVGKGGKESYVGKMSGYGPDCPGCSKTGNVSCHTKNGGKHSLIYDGIYYQDEEYGNVRILAAAKTVFPCGTIIEINNGINPPFLGVVLDSGSSMQKAWNSSRTVWIDLAYATQNDARNTTTPGGNGIQFTVKRYGF